MDCRGRVEEAQRPASSRRTVQRLDQGEEPHASGNGAGDGGIQVAGFAAWLPNATIRPIRNDPVICAGLRTNKPKGAKQCAGSVGSAFSRWRCRWRGCRRWGHQIRPEQVRQCRQPLIRALHHQELLLRGLRAPRHRARPLLPEA